MAANQIPEKMKGLAITAYSQPKDYTVLPTLDVPKITKPDDILIRVAAASFNPIDVKFAAGMVKMFVQATFPYKIGLDVSGVVAAVGDQVKNVNVGDEVFTKVPLEYRGTCAEYVLGTDATTVQKPKNLSFKDAASIPLVGLTALECLRWADSQLEGGLRGKTVLIPAGMGGTGSMAIQLALYHFNAGKVITTLSTGKMAMAKEFFGHEAEVGTGKVEGILEYVDYTKEDIFQKVPAASVDVLFDNLGVGNTYASLLKRGSVIVSIAGLPSGDDIKAAMPGLPLVAKWGINAIHGALSFRFSAVGIKYRYIFMHETHEMMMELKRMVEAGIIKPLVGASPRMDDVEELRKKCQEIYDGKGVIGKVVAEVWNPETSA